MPVQRLRRWPSIESTMVQLVVFARGRMLGDLRFSFRGQMHQTLYQQRKKSTVILKCHRKNKYRANANSSKCFVLNKQLVNYYC